MKKIIISLCLLAMLAQTAMAAELLKPWADTWTIGSYNTTNLEDKNFKTFLGRAEGRIGITLLPMWGDTTLNPYVVYVGAISGYPHFWTNFIATGVGARFYPFYNLEQGNFFREIKIFAESLNASYLTDQTNAKDFWRQGATSPEARPTDDFRYGLDAWYEWNQPQSWGQKSDHSAPWGEFWLNLSWRTTNLLQSDFNTYLLQFQPKIGIFTSPSDDVPGVEPYILGDLTMSGKQHYWLNIMQYGIGARIQPFRNENTQGIASIFYKLKVFFELRWATYLSAQPTDGRPNNDIRFGAELTSGR